MLSPDINVSCSTSGATWGSNENCANRWVLKPLQKQMLVLQLCHVKRNDSCQRTSLSQFVNCNGICKTASLKASSYSSSATKELDDDCIARGETSKCLFLSVGLFRHLICVRCAKSVRLETICLKADMSPSLATCTCCCIRTFRQIEVETYCTSF